MSEPIPRQWVPTTTANRHGVITNVLKEDVSVENGNLQKVTCIACSWTVGSCGHSCPDVQPLLDREWL